MAAGSAFPYGKDPRDTNIRVTPPFPSLAEVEQAAEGLSLPTLVADTDALLAQRGAVAGAVMP